MTNTKRTAEKSGNERRSRARVPAQIEIRFAARAQAAKAFRAYSLNFSVGGLCLKTSREYPVGTTLRVRMTVEGHAFELDATVAWVHKGAIGIRFENVGEQEQARLEELKDVLARKAADVPEAVLESESEPFFPIDD